MKTKQWAVMVGMALVFLTGLLFRVGYQAQTVVNEPIRADAAQYAFIAWNMVHHGVVSMQPPAEAVPQPDSYRGPGYPALIVLALKLGGAQEDGWYERLLFLQALLGGLTALLVAATARYWLPTAYALAAGMLVALWPHMVTMSGYVLTETFFSFLLVLGVYLFARAWKALSLPWAGLAGLVFGVAALVNPVITPFPLLIGAWLAFSQRRQAAVFLVAALLLPAAWSLRSANLDTATAATANGRFMENVLIGMEPDFATFHTGNAAGLQAWQRVQDQLKVYRQEKGQAWQDVADRLAGAPGFYAKWYFLEKPTRFWAWSIGQGAGDIYVYLMLRSAFDTNPLYRGVVAVARGLNQLLMLSAFVMTGLLLLQWWRNRAAAAAPALLAVALMFFYATAVHSVLTPDARYATPFRPFEILMAVSLLCFLHQRVLAARQEKQAVVATDAIKPAAAAE